MAEAEAHRMSMLSLLLHKADPMVLGLLSLA